MTAGPHDDSAVDSKEIFWVWGEAELEWPHRPSMLPGGRILVFDNRVERLSPERIEPLLEGSRRTGRERMRSKP